MERGAIGLEHAEISEPSGLFMRGNGMRRELCACTDGSIYTHPQALCCFPAAPLASAKRLRSEIALDGEVPVHYTSIFVILLSKGSKQPADGQK